MYRIMHIEPGTGVESVMAETATIEELLDVGASLLPAKSEEPMPGQGTLFDGE